MNKFLRGEVNKMKKNDILITIILVVVVGAVAFFGGMKYQENTQTGGSRQFQAGQGQRAEMMGQQSGNTMGRNGFRPVSGEIISINGESSVTVKLSDGSTKIVLLSSSTAVDKTSVASKSDLKVGEKVAAFGQANSDGSITAQNIQLNPQTRLIQRPTGQ
jgi:hypothetical protein